MLRRIEQEGGEPRLFMLQTIREFAMAELTERGEVHAARTAHASYYVDSADRPSVRLSGDEEAHWLNRVDLEIDNIRAALDWAIRAGNKSGALSLVISVKTYWLIRSSFAEALHWIEQGLMLPSEIEPDLRLRVSRFAAWLYTMAGDHERATVHAEASLALAEQIGDAAGNAIVLNTLGAIAYQRGNLGEASRWWEAALERADPSSNTGMLAGIYNNLGVAACFH